MIEISLDKSAIGAVAREMPLGAPCFMLNLLRYREMADYGVDGSRESACTGREAYFGRYVPAFTRVANNEAIAPIFVARFVGSIVAPAGEVWDDIAIVRYPDFEAFRTVVEGEAYRMEAAPHRLAALADWRLVASAEPQTLGASSRPGR